MKIRLKVIEDLIKDNGPFADKKWLFLFSKGEGLK